MAFIGEAALGQGYGVAYSISTASYCQMRYPDDTGPTLGTTWGMYGAMAANAYNLPQGVDAFGGGFYDLPVFIASNTAAYRGIRGRLQDIYYFPGGATTGTVDSTPGAPQFMIVGPQDTSTGGWWFPTDQAPIL